MVMCTVPYADRYFTPREVILMKKSYFSRCAAAVAAISVMTAFGSGFSALAAVNTNVSKLTAPVVQDSYKPGDANTDTNINVADAVAILQYVANKSKYPLSNDGIKNADVFNCGDGITGSDAISIQKYDAGIITSLPESYAENSNIQPETQPPVQQPTQAPYNPWQQPTEAPVQQPTEAPQNPGSNGIKDYGTPMNANAKAVADFRKGSTPLFFASDGWTNGNPFDCGWYKGNTSLDNGMLTLKIDRDYTGKYNYSGAEYRTSDHYGYGYYETSMQAIKNPGVVSSFFTYTGQSENNPWDEIDIEVLGKDTTKVQFNYYTNGQGKHEFMYDLGFDASEGFHTYGFDWQPDHITWYVDGKAVYTANQNIPSTPGRIMMNTWPGTGVDEWLNHYDGRTPLEAHYQWVTFDDKTPGGNGSNGNNGEWNWQQPTQAPYNPWQQPTEAPVQQPTQAPQNPGSNGIKDYGTPMDSSADAVADFRKGSTPLFFASDGWTNGNPFDCGWYKGNTSLDNGMLTLKIDRDYTGKYNYSGAEYRTSDHYGYGYYETSMQAIKNPGVVSSFFTYTGQSENNPWDEIDIEVLGKDTTKVQFNYYTNGQGKHEFMYDLGFDASEGFHTYGFDWQPDHITWYVDGKAVYTANQNIPSTPGRIMMNTWPGTGVDEWLNHYDGRTPLEAHYQWVTFTKK